VRQVTLPTPGTQAQLEACAAALHGELLDRRHPLWQLVVIDGLQTGQAAYYIKVHHAVLDGQAGVMLGLALCDLSAKPPRRALPAAPPAEHPGRAALAAVALRHDAGQYIKLLRHLPDVVRTLAGLFTPAPPAARGQLAQNLAFGPKTPLNVTIDGRRGFAAATVPLTTLKALAVAHDAKLNDIVLALCSGALRRWLAAHGGVPKKPLIAAMPISLRAAGNTEYTTQATMTLVNLHTDIADPLRRLRAIRDGALAMKTLAQRARRVIPTDYPTFGMPWLLHGLATLYGRSGLTRALPTIANLVISNVPGPTVPLYAAGARMATYWPMSIVEHGLGLNVTVMSYAGAMGFGFTVATDAVPEAGELTLALQAALDELLARSGLVPKPKPMPKPVAAARRRRRATPATAR
jgi:WS/DGAT/MGAT family acyltransferase